MSNLRGFEMDLKIIKSVHADIVEHLLIVKTIDHIINHTSLIARSNIMK